MLEDPVINSPADGSKLKIGDCVIVKLMGKRGDKYFAAQVIEHDKEDKFIEVHYLKKCGESKRCFNIDPNDIGSHDYNECVYGPFPFLLNTRGQLSFQFDLPLI